METKTVKFTEATRDELFEYATESLGLEAHHMLGAPKLRAKIKAAKTDITEFMVRVPEPEVEAVVLGPVMDIDPDEMAEPIYEIVILEGKESEDQAPVPVSVNGVNLFIPRNTPAKIKHRYWHALNNAVQILYDQPDGPEGDMVPRRVPAYPVNTLKYPPQAELDAWDAYRAKLQADEVAAKQAA